LAVTVLLFLIKLLLNYKSYPTSIIGTSFAMFKLSKIGKKSLLFLFSTISSLLVSGFLAAGTSVFFEFELSFLVFAFERSSIGGTDCFLLMF
jgi:hypothetical protein